MSENNNENKEQEVQRELKRIVNELKQYEGRGTQLVSVYIPPEKQISDVVAHISNEYGEAQNIKRKNTRKNVQSALSSIKSRLKYYDTVPENGMALFSGVVDENTGNQETFVVDELPIEISSYRYHCDDEFLVEPLEAALNTGEVYGLVVLDRRTAQIGKLVGDRIVHIDTLRSNIMGKHRAGGQSAKRFDRLIEEALHNFFKKIAERVNSEFVEDRHDINGIIVGGPSPTKDEFLDTDGIHHELDVIGVFDIDDTTERGLNQLVQRAHDVIEESQLVEQRKLMERFLEQLRTDDGQVAYGDDEVVRALNMGAVDKLLVSEPRAVDDAYVMECSNGHEEVEFSEKSLDICSTCGDDLEVVETETLAKFVEDLAQERGTEVFYISDSFEEGQQLKSVFGGLAALLRFNPR